MQRRRLTLIILALVALSAVIPMWHARAAGPDHAACLVGPGSPGCTAGLPTVEYQMLLDEMLLHPHPNVRPIPPNMDEIARFAFRKIVGGTATIYDAPGGNAIGTIGEGFNYVTVGGVQGDWIQINDGRKRDIEPDTT